MINLWRHCECIILSFIGPVLYVKSKEAIFARLAESDSRALTSRPRSSRNRNQRLDLQGLFTVEEYHTAQML